MRTLAIALAVAVAFTLPASAKPPVEAFAALPAMRGPQLSPDGRYLAAVQPIDGRPGVTVYTVGAPAGTQPAAIRFAGWIVRGVRWVSNERLMVVGGKTDEVQRDLWTIARAVLISPDGSNTVRVLDNVPSLQFNGSGAAIVDLTIDDPADILMALGARSGGYYFRRSLFRVDLQTGAGRKLDVGGADTGWWLTDGAGSVLARLDFTDDPLREHLLVPDGDDWREIASEAADADNGLNVVGVSEDGRGAMRIVRIDGRDALARIDLATGAETVVYKHPSRDVDNVVRDPWTGLVVGVSAADGAPVYFDTDRRKAQAALQKAFPGQAVFQASETRDRTKLVAVVDSPRTPATYYFVDRKTKLVTEIMASYPGLTADDLGEMKPYDYTARDGLHIPAFITLPPGVAPKNLPAIVMPHGGPDAHDSLGFDWWAQFLANRGYVVLQPNYRGSSGYGRAFTEAGLHQWGLKMQDDISDGVLKMIADGIADPKRVCIVGASYGGYAALAGATLTPDLYACAVAVAGVSDLAEMLADARNDAGATSGLVSFWTSRIGDLSKDADQIEATSPAMQAAHVKCPILLMHGENDTTVPIEQSEIMADWLKAKGKPFSFVRFKGDDHYLQLAETRQVMLTEIEKFLEANIGH